MTQNVSSNMNFFSKLEGFQRSPAGLEWEIWKRIRLIWVTGTVLPLISSGGAFLLNGFEYTRSVEQFFYVMVGLVILHWALVLTLAIGCVIVMLMKGPAYVADAYAMHEPSPVSDSGFNKRV
jgi:type IV secretory pathway VirB6-like protein